MPQIVDGYQRGDAAEIGPLVAQTVARGETVTLQVSGDSMRPTLKPRRDAVVLSKLEKWPPERGTILFFCRDTGEYVLHRVLRVKENGCVMNGDAQQWTEGPITREMVIAQERAILRNGQLIDSNNRRYRAYVRLWRLTKPIRWPLFAVWRTVKRLLGK